jgi:hypothetical protein
MGRLARSLVGGGGQYPPSRHTAALHLPASLIIYLIGEQARLKARGLRPLTARLQLTADPAHCF